MSDGVVAKGFSWLNNPQNPLQRGAANINNWLDTSQGVTAGLGRSFTDIGRGVTASRQAGGWFTPEGRQLAAQAAKQAAPWVAGGAGAKAGATAVSALRPAAGKVFTGLGGLLGAGVAERGAEMATGVSMVAPPRTTSTSSVTPGMESAWERELRQSGTIGGQAPGMLQAAQPAARQVPQYQEPEWIAAMAGLSPTQSWEFERAAREADESLKQLREQAKFERERGRVATGARLREASQAGAGSGVDLQSALARRGLGTSMATSGVGQEFIAGRTAQERAGARGRFEELDARLTRETTLAGAARDRRLAELRMQEQAQRQENEAAAQAAAKQYRDWWLSQYG